MIFASSLANWHCDEFPAAGICDPLHNPTPRIGYLLTKRRDSGDP
jgi:hypothetical protein